MIHIQNYDGPIYVAPEKTSICTKTCDNPNIHTKIFDNPNFYTKHCDNPSILSYKSACDPDCKCTAKILPNVNIIPLNTVSQGSCYYPYNQEGYAYQGCPQECPQVTALIPLLKTLTQQGCHTCSKCGKTYSSY